MHGKAADGMRSNPDTRSHPKHDDVAHPSNDTFRSTPRRGLAVAIGAACLALAPLPAAAAQRPVATAGQAYEVRKAMSTTQQTRNPARDGNIAIREEFDAAVAQNTAAALELFILRHPDHPLAAEARLRLDALTARADEPKSGN